MIPEAWIPHRRDDGEVVGWIDMTVAEPRLVPIDRLGRPLEPVHDWHEAEEALEAVGLRFLMDRFVYDESGSAAGGAGEADSAGEAGAGGEIPGGGTVVRIAHVYDDRIVLSTALTDAVEDVGREIILPFPAPDTLQPLD